jgi:protein-S-isoprenylcysteine O-methyltransferase Ste14
MGSIAAWLGGAVFVAALAVCAWWFVVPLDRSLPFQGWAPAGFDTLLFSVFALHHSLFARDGVKAALGTIVPDRWWRTVYVSVASLLLIAACLLWRRVGGTLFDAGGWAARAHAAAQLLGLALIARSTAAIDPLELAGIRRPDRTSSGGLQTTGLYGWVRHPLYLGWVLAVWGAGHMTGDRALFAGISTLYLVLAVPYEERALVAAFGDEYRRYQRRIRWKIVPYVY